MYNFGLGSPDASAIPSTRFWYLLYSGPVAFFAPTDAIAISADL